MMVLLEDRTFEFGADVGHLLVDSFFLEFADTTYLVMQRGCIIRCVVV